MSILNDGLGMKPFKIRNSKNMMLADLLRTQFVEHLREYIANLQNEREWDNLVSKTQNNLIKAAKQAKQEIAEGKSQPMNYEKL